MISWKRSQETKAALNKLHEEIDQTIDTLISGVLLQSPDLVKEYCVNIGNLKGLRFIENLLKEGDEDGRIEFED